MEKQQKLQDKECQTCGQPIPINHFDIHTVRCNMKKQSALMSKTSRLSSSKTLRKPKIFQPKVQIEKQPEQKISCPLCGYMQTFMELDTHPDKCLGKQSTCQFCGDSYPSELLQQHESLCEANNNRNDLNQDYQNELESPFDRLARLIDLVNSIGSMISNMQQEEDSLTENDIKQLKRFKYRPVKQEQLCTICYCKLEKDEDCLQLRCKHIYHNECISKWLQRSCKCPLCKHNQKLPK